MAWGLLFLWVPIFGVGTFVVAKKMGWWLPPGVSTYSQQIDDLFFLIFWITGIAFVVTEVALVAFLLMYRSKEGHKSKFAHSHKTLEIVWTIIPGLILFGLAIYQKDTWDLVKKRETFPTQGWKVRVTAKQFAWEFLYPGPDGVFDTEDDCEKGQLYVPVDEPTIISLRSRDVLHSFFLPHMRVKQDAVPGAPGGKQIEIPVWFEPTVSTEQMRAQLYDALMQRSDAPAEYPKTYAQIADVAAFRRELRGKVGDVQDAIDEAKASGTAPPVRTPAQGWEKKIFDAVSFNYELACAELCGLGHYQMQGRLVVTTRAECEAYATCE